MIVDTLTELYRIFHELEKNIFKTKFEEPVILIQSRKNNILGTFTVGKVWKNKKDKNQKHEITITAESLNRSTEEIISTLLHEMVHLYCSLKDIKDTSNNYVYHNKRYKEEAERFGLEIEHAKTIGWSLSKLSPETKRLILKFKIKEQAFAYYRQKFTKGSDSKKIEYNKYMCPNCEAKVTSYKKLNLICGDCKKPFVERD